MTGRRSLNCSGPSVRAALREAFTHLPPDSRQLIALLIQDPPVSYAEISAKLGIPVGSIGPNRARCLEKLRRYPAIAALINAEAPERRSGHMASPRQRTNRQIIAACLPRRMRGARELAPMEGRAEIDDNLFDQLLKLGRRLPDLTLVCGQVVQFQVPSSAASRRAE